MEVFLALFSPPSRPSPARRLHALQAKVVLGHCHAAALGFLPQRPLQLLKKCANLNQHQIIGIGLLPMPVLRQHGSGLGGRLVAPPQC